MHLVVLSNPALKEELLWPGTQPGATLTWIDNVQQFLQYPDAGVFLDLLFQPDAERMNVLQALQKPVIVNSVLHTTADLAASFIRINGWPTFLKGTVLEASGHEDLKKLTEEVATVFNRSVEWVPDVAGFVTPRVISMIINEAYFALEENVSSKNEIDIALKMGTNYPYGPFEWSQKIGLQNVAALLTALSNQQPRYTPAPLLLQESGHAI